MKKQKALAICTTAIGDTILSTPALESLGRVYDLDVVVHKHRLPLFLGNPFINLLYPYRPNLFYRLGLGLRLGGTKYHRVLVLHANSDIKKLLPWLKYELAGNIQGWEDPKHNLVALSPADELHVVNKRLELVAWAGAEPVDHGLKMYLSPAELKDAEDWLVGRGLEAVRPRVILCPGAANAYKCWPADRFGKLAAMLAEAGAKVLVVGSQGEAELAARLMEQAGETKPVLALGEPLRLTAGILARSDLIITNDTGPMHMAVSVGLPVLALFGPTDPDTIGPRAANSMVLKVPRICDPCTTKKCPKNGECMEALALEDVALAAGQMLAKGPGPRGRS